MANKEANALHNSNSLKPEQQTWCPPTMLPLHTSPRSTSETSSSRSLSSGLLRKTLIAWGVRCSVPTPTCPELLGSRPLWLRWRQVLLRCSLYLASKKATDKIILRPTLCTCRLSREFGWFPVVFMNDSLNSKGWSGSILGWNSPGISSKQFYMLYMYTVPINESIFINYMV